VQPVPDQEGLEGQTFDLVPMTHHVKAVENADLVLLHDATDSATIASWRQTQLSSFPRHIDFTKRRVAACWRPVSYLKAVRLICPQGIAPKKLQRGCKSILKSNAMLFSMTSRFQAIHYFALPLDMD
jgi:hypothetical protein